MSFKSLDISVFILFFPGLKQDALDFILHSCLVVVSILIQVDSKR